MPNEKSDQHSAGDTDEERLTIFEANAASKQKAEMRQSGTGDSKQYQSDTKELAREIHWVEKATMWSQFGLAVIGVIALFIYHAQLLAMQKQLDEMKSGSVETHALAVAAKIQAIAAASQANTLAKTLESSQRPWVAVDASPGGPLTINRNGVIARVRVHFVNVGHSPAIQVRVAGQLGDFFGGSPNSLLPNPYTTQKHICDALAKDPDPNERVLFPNGDYNVVFGAVMQPDEVAKAVLDDGSIHPILVGCVDYQYSFEIRQHHQTRFAYSISAQGRQLRPTSGDIPKSAVEISPGLFGVEAY